MDSAFVVLLGGGVELGVDVELRVEAPMVIAPTTRTTPQMVTIVENVGMLKVVLVDYPMPYNETDRSGLGGSCQGFAQIGQRC